MYKEETNRSDVFWCSQDDDDEDDDDEVFWVKRWII